ncbi:MAG: RHS repeat-associated core domain-containing protein [Flavobacterium sp.]|nr:MAG: RHS repeat-associated core domain-containing protein [Flavobacterium sp.]
MGGNYNFTYGYDQLNRLIGSGGGFNGSQGAFSTDQADFSLNISYNHTGGFTNKSQNHNQNQVQNTLNSYSNTYTYNSGTHKVQNIINTNTGDQENFDYDANGNIVIYDKNGDVDKMYWDEQDRLKAVDKNFAGVFQYNVYDDQSDRIIKYNLSAGSQLYQNGSLVDAGTLEIKDYKIYPNPYVTLDANKILTKHYYGGSQRVASRIGMHDFTTMRQADNLKPSDKKNEPDTETDFKLYLTKAGIDFKDIKTELAKNGPPEPNVYYLHGDHLGTANFVTEQHGDATQFFVNLPFGETMAEQMTGVYDNPFKFNAKELDSDTGLYYYGARYYNPRLSIWYGVDPMAEKTPNWSPFVYTFNNPVRYVDPTGMIPEDPDPPGASIRIPRNGCGCFDSKTPGFSLRVGDTGGPWGNSGSTTVWGIIGGKDYYNSNTSAPGIIPKLDEPNAFIQLQIRVGGERSNSQIGLTWFKEKFHGNESDGFGFEAPTAVHASFSKNNLNEIKSGQLSITTNFSLAGGVELGVPRSRLSEDGTEDFGKGYRVIGFGGSAIYRVDATYRQVSVFVAATGHIMRTNSVTSNITTHGSEIIGSVGLRAGVGINIGRK